MADHEGSIHFITDEQRGGDPADNEEEHVQFEECNVTTCTFYNEEGYCSFETCRINLENPATAKMVTKTCQFCGQQFAVNFNEMVMQVCPQCFEMALKAEAHPHECVFCGEKLDMNPSPFMPICSDCLKMLKIVTDGDLTAILQASNIAWC